MWALMNSPPLSELSISVSNGASATNDPSAAHTPAAPLFHTARNSVQAEATSVIVSVHAKLPAIEPPQWATVSTST